MSTHAERIGSVLREATHWPYNDFGKVHLFEGRTFPSEQLGGNCVWVAKRLMAVLGPEFDQIRPVKSGPGSCHFGVVGKLDEEEFYMDPGLFLDAPIPLEQVRKDGEIRREVFPITETGPTIFSFRFDSNGHLFVERDGLARSSRPIVQFSMIVNALDAFLPPLNDRRIAFLNTNGVRLRTLDDQGIERCLRVLPSFSADLTVRGGGQASQRYEPSFTDSMDPELRTHLAQMESATGMRFGEIMPLMFRAVSRLNW